MADEINEMQQELAPFDPTKKKKKKKVVLQDHVESSTESQMEKPDDSMPAAVNDGHESTLTGMKDNKKPVDSSSLNEESVEAVKDLDGDNEEEKGVIQQENRYPWEGSDRFYLYEEVNTSQIAFVFKCIFFKIFIAASDEWSCMFVQMLGRVFNTLREHNPDLTGNRRRTIMRPPQVLREGTKKTVFVNFMDLCKTYEQTSASSNSIDHVAVLDSPDTNLAKENRLFFMRCEQCGSKRSVEQIKAGYVALVGKRKT
ncbi:hypothetical protein Bca4012_019687 [Brassica carinata]